MVHRTLEVGDLLDKALREITLGVQAAIHHLEVEGQAHPEETDPQEVVDSLEMGAHLPAVAQVAVDRPEDPAVADHPEAPVVEDRLVGLRRDGVPVVITVHEAVGGLVVALLILRLQAVVVQEMNSGVMNFPTREFGEIRLVRVFSRSLPL